MDPIVFLTPLAGGALIGLSAVLLMALNGRIAGISGIVGGLLPPAAEGDRAWRVAFVVGLVAGPLVATALLGRPTIGAPVPSLAVLVAGGLLVGAGTALGSGCTSGHGVCGMARLSPRSIVATLTFMAAGALVVFVTRHLI